MSIDPETARQLTEFTRNAAQYGMGWGCLSMIIASLAEVKNRSFWGWLILGILLGPIALGIQAFFCDKIKEQK